MSIWLSHLHSFFSQRQPFVIATVTAYEGNSPDEPGACVFYSHLQTVKLLGSETRFEQILDNAKSALGSQQSYTLEKIPLGEVASHNNGHCDIIYEFWQALEYPLWLKQLRESHQKGIDALLVREFNAQTGGANSRVLTKPFNYEIFNTSSFLQSTSKCYLNTQNGNPVLLRKVFNTHIQLTVIGSHSVANEITNMAATLPVDLQQIQTQDCIDTNLQNIPAESYVVVMTGDHAIDYQCSHTLLKRADLSFVGCIGSDKKAKLFAQQFRADQMPTAQLSQLQMPVGLEEISGKQPAVVAASIIAQILSLHKW